MASTGPNPSLLFSTLNAYQQTAALKGAIQLDLFTAIAEGNATVPALAARIQASEKGTRVLCDYLTIHGFLAKENGRYANTPESAAFLDRRSASYMGDIARFLASPEQIAAFQDVAAIVRKGGSINPGEWMQPDDPTWIEFAQSMAAMARRPAERVATLIGAAEGKPWKVLDLAASHGLYGIAIAQQNPNAHIVALDWPAVVTAAKQNAQTAGVADRLTTLEGSAFDLDFGSGYDLVLITNFLQILGPEENATLLRKVHDALKPGGRTVTLGFVPNEDRISPSDSAAFAMIMLGATPRGDAYPFSDYREMFAAAGFERSEIFDMPPSAQRLIVSYR